MDDSEETQPLENNSSDQFHQLFLRYIQQVSRCFPADPAIQKAVKRLEERIKKPD